MKKVPTQINRQYALTTATECTVTAGNGMLLCTATAGEQKIFTAISDFVELSDDGAILSLLFGKFTENSTADIPQPCHTGALPELIQAGHVYDLGELNGSCNLEALAFPESHAVQTAELWFSTGSEVPSIVWPSNAVWLDDSEPTLTPATAYRFSLRREPAGNLIINLAYEYELSYDQ